MTGLCVGIIVGISTNAVLSELQPSIPTQVVVQVRDAAEKPALAAAPMSTQRTVAASPTSAQPAAEVLGVGTSPTAVSVDTEMRTTSTDGRGGEAAIDRRAAAALTTSGAPPANSAPAGTPAESAASASALPAATPWVETADAPKPATEPAINPAAGHVSQPPRVVQKKRKKPTNYSNHNQNPFFPFFGGGNGPFFGQRG